jgi:hypothetical protein
MEFGFVVSTVAETIQIAIAPVFLLAGIAGLLNVLTGRLARVIDRARALEQLHPRTQGVEHDRHVWELRRIDRRITVINASISLVTGSAIAICAVVGLLFIAELSHLNIGTIVASAFIGSMGFLILGLICFLFEVRMSARASHIRAELLERDRKRLDR